MTTSTITTAARRITRALNAEYRSGVLAFDAEGKGGEWYSIGSCVPARLVFGIPAGRRVTEREIQEAIEEGWHNGTMGPWR